MLPKVDEKTVVATMDRAQSRTGIQDYTLGMMKKMHKENTPMLQALCVLIDGFGLDERSSLTTMTAIGLMYDCLTTQIESDELNDMFGEGELPDAQV